jgi:hypothetical protein
MPTLKNSILVTRVIEALYTVVGRRTLDSFAIQVIKTVVKKLGPTYDFFNLIKVYDEFFVEGGVKVVVDPVLETVDPSLFGEGIDALIRVMYMEFAEYSDDDVGLYFITELKQHLGDVYVDELRVRGVNFELIQLEQHTRHQMKGLQPGHPSPILVNEPEESEYTWDTVSTWKYENNVCRLYNSSGKLLDTLQLDLIIEEYIERVTEIKEKKVADQPKSTMLRVTEKDDELLAMLRRQDLDMESAVTLLHISQQKLEVIIQKLLQLELLKYISDNEVKLTEKGLQYITEKKESDAAPFWKGD